MEAEKGIGLPCFFTKNIAKCNLVMLGIFLS